jgi:hypothetical protein
MSATAAIGVKASTEGDGYAFAHAGLNAFVELRTGLSFDDHVRITMEYSIPTGATLRLGSLSLSGRNFIDFLTNEYFTYPEFSLELKVGGYPEVVADSIPHRPPEWIGPYPPSDSESVSQFAGVHWTVYGLNGETIRHGTQGSPFEGTPGIVPGDPDDDDDVEADIPAMVSGSFLTFPVSGEIGHASSAFSALPTRVVDGPSAGALMTGYRIASAELPITSLMVPELPGGVSELVVSFSDISQPVIAGQSIDFGPGGVLEFTLSGFDPAAASSALDAFAFGLQFASEGLAALTAVPTLYHPPGDYDRNAFVNGGDLLVWQRKVGLNENVQADGTGDGIVDGLDLAFWQERFGAPLAPEANPSADNAPEPTGLILAGLALAAVASTSSRRRLWVGGAHRPRFRIAEFLQLPDASCAPTTH